MIDDCLTEEDREFLLKVMMLDPKARPTATQLLQDKWFMVLEYVKGVHTGRDLI